MANAAQVFASENWLVFREDCLYFFTSGKSTMHKMNKFIFVGSVFLIVALAGCAAHTTISPDPLQKGEKVKYITLSSETIIPVVTWRYGLSNRSDLGLHAGIPIYGTGIDYSYRLSQDDRGGGDILNAGVFLTPNANLDFTYYKIGALGKSNRLHSTFGWRIMYIPSGILNQGSVRFGFLTGFSVRDRFGVEVGYFHDFIGDGEPWYHDTLIATEKNPLTGLSLRFNFFMGRAGYERK